MRKRKNKFNSDFLGERPSDFVVNLKEQLLEAEKSRERERKKFQGLGIEDFYEKVEEFSFRKCFIKSKERLSGAIKTPVNKLCSKGANAVRLGRKNLKLLPLTAIHPRRAVKKLKFLNDKLKELNIKFDVGGLLKNGKKKAVKIKKKAKRPINKLSFAHYVNPLIVNKTLKSLRVKLKSVKFNNKKEKPAVLKIASNLWRIAARKNSKLAKKLRIPRLAASTSETSHPLRPVISFALILFLLILPFKAFTYYKSFSGLSDLRGKVLGASEEAVNNLLSAGQFAGEMDFKEAQENFSQAAGQFLAAQNELGGINNILFSLASVAPDKNLRLASESKNILAAGERAAELGKNLSLAVNSLLNNKDKTRSAGEALDDFAEYGGRAVMDAGDLSILLDEIDSENIPVEFREKFKLARKTAEFLKESLDEFIDLARVAQIFLGSNDLKRYLVVFQNNAEMRATGGFIGSYALVDFSNGGIKNIEVPAGGSYDTEGGLKERIIAPEPLHLVNPLWYFWDANWWPDWPTSAKKLSWFYERSGGPTVDGVISLTPTVLERVLDVIGPIDMTEEYGVVVTAENFWETTREVIEKSASGNVSESAVSIPPEIAVMPQVGDQRPAADFNSPKKIIGDLTRKIIEELPARLNKEILIGLMRAMEISLNEKQILFYFNDKKLQDKVEEYGWDGKIRHTSRDYLSVINTNIAGGKSDRKIKEIIDIKTEVQTDGSIVNTVKISRTHFGSKYENFSGVRNVDWMRIYTPLGSKLIEAGGFTRPDDIYFEHPDDGWQEDPDVLKWEGSARVDEVSGTKIYEEAGKTVFANWSMVDPGETVTVYLKYKLPFRFQEKEPYTVMEKIKESLNPGQKESHSYSLLVQKQSGSYNSEINSSLILPDNMNIAWYFPEWLNGGRNGWQINEQLDTDKYWAAIIVK